MSSHPYLGPATCHPGLHPTFALLHRPQASLHFCTSTPNRSPRINQLLPFELLKGEAGEGAVIDEEDDDAGAGERIGEGNEFRPALQRLRQSGHVRFDGEDFQAGVGKMRGDLDGRRFAEVIDVRLQGERR